MCNVLQDQWGCQGRAPSLLVHLYRLPQCMLGYHPSGPDTPGPDSPHPRTGAGTPLGTRHPPQSRHPPQQTATVADGTHPTGMHSCFSNMMQFSGEMILTVGCSPTFGTETNRDIVFTIKMGHSHRNPYCQIFCSAPSG